MRRKIWATHRIQETRPNRRHSRRRGRTRNAAGCNSGCDTEMCFRCMCCWELLTQNSKRQLDKRRMDNVKNTCFERWKLPQPATASSSLPSGQSLSPSHNQFLGTQAYEPGQLKRPGAHVTKPADREKKRVRHIFPNPQSQANAVWLMNIHVFWENEPRLIFDTEEIIKRLPDADFRQLHRKV